MTKMVQSMCDFCNAYQMRHTNFEYSSTTAHASVEATATDEVEGKAQTALGEETDLIAPADRDDGAE